MKYEASIQINNKLTKINFELKNDENPIEYLWGRYGMDTYIEYLKEIEENLPKQ